MQDLFRRVAAASTQRRFTLESLASADASSTYLCTAATVVYLLELIPTVVSAQRMCVPDSERQVANKEFVQYYNPYFILYHLQLCFKEILTEGLRAIVVSKARYTAYTPPETAAVILLKHTFTVDSHSSALGDLAVWVFNLDAEDILTELITQANGLDTSGALRDEGASRPESMVPTPTHQAMGSTVRGLVS